MSPLHTSLLILGLWIPALVLAVTEKSDLIALDTKIIFAKVGQSVNILAKAREGRVIQFCRWDSLNNTKVGKSGIVFVNKEDDIPSFSIMAQQSPDGKNREVPGYSTFGAGLSRGECGITIDNVEDADFTTWKYLLIEFSKEEGNPTAVTRDLKLERPVTPSPPIISNKELFKNMPEVNDTFSTIEISCCSRHGVPHPKLDILFNNEVKPTRVVVHDDIPEICVVWENAHFTKEDNGKIMKCVAEHLMTIGMSQQDTEDLVTISIASMPTLLTRLTHQFNNTVVIQRAATENEIRIGYYANPEPRVIWYKQDVDGGYFEVENDEAFQSSVAGVMPYTWESVLKFKSDEVRKQTHTFKVVSWNEIGRIETFVLVFAPHTGNGGNVGYPLPDPESDTDRPMWYWIVLAIVLFVVLIIAITICILISRANAWCCWKNHKGKYVTKEGTKYRTPDNEFDNCEKEDLVYNSLSTSEKV